MVEKVNWLPSSNAGCVIVFVKQLQTIEFQIRLIAIIKGNLWVLNSVEWFSTVEPFFFRCIVLLPSVYQIFEKFQQQFPIFVIIIPFFSYAKQNTDKCQQKNHVDWVQMSLNYCDDIFYSQLLNKRKKIISSHYILFFLREFFWGVNNW